MLLGRTAAGQTVNLMTLGGIAAALGLVADEHVCAAHRPGGQVDHQPPGLRVDPAAYLVAGPHLQAGLLLDLAQEALLEAFAERNMAARQVPAPGSIAHLIGPPEHEYAPAIRDHAVNAHEKLHFCH